MRVEKSWSEIFKEYQRVEPNSAESNELMKNTVFPKAFGFLRDDSNVITHVDSKDTFYQSVLDLERAILGGNVSESEIHLYQSGGQLLFDALTESAKSMNTTRQSSGVGLSTMVLASQVLISLPILKNLILGQYDFINNCGPVGDGISSDSIIRICSGNIKKVAATKNLECISLFRYTLIHEEIHNWQAHNTKMQSIRKELTDRGDINEIMNYMVLVEGHAEFFTDMISNRLLTEFRLERSVPGLIDKIIYKITGLDKMRNRYIIGKKFFEDVYMLSDGNMSMINDVLNYMVPNDKYLNDPSLFVSTYNEGLKTHGK